MAASRNYEFNLLLSYNVKETVLISVVGIRHVVIKFSTIFNLTWRSEVTVFSSFFLSSLFLTSLGPEGKRGKKLSSLIWSTSRKQTKAHNKV